MTDTDPATESNEPNIDETQMPPDFPLAKLVILVNRSPGGEVGITLTTSGTVLSGLLVSGLSYFEHVKTKLASSGFDFLFDEQTEHYQEVADADSLDYVRELARTRFIHLREVTIYGGAQQISLDTWRGRLDHVSGWSLGMLTSDA